jgi:hypothetical protein
MTRGRQRDREKGWRGGEGRGGEGRGIDMSQTSHALIQRLKKQKHNKKQTNFQTVRYGALQFSQRLIQHVYVLFRAMKMRLESPKQYKIKDLLTYMLQLIAIVYNIWTVHLIINIYRGI